jgi:DNA ligase-1
VAGDDQQFTPDPRSVALIGKRKTDTSVKSTSIKPMLAQKATLNKIAKPMFVQPKLDGVRAVWDASKKALFTRNGKQITSCDHIVKALIALEVDHDLDGELFCWDMPFETLNGLVARKSASDACSSIEFHVFDFVCDKPTYQRMSWLPMLVGFLRKQSQRVPIKVVEARLLKPGQLQEWFDSFVADDFEGMVLREPESPYIHDRTDALLKVKPVMDMEAEIIGFEPAKTGRNKHTFAALVVRLPNGKQFRCSGISDQQRSMLWRSKPIGSLVTFSYEGFFKTGVPRFPRFKSLRFDLEVVR